MRPEFDSTEPDQVLSEELKRVLEMDQRYKNVFGTPEGRVVLGDVLAKGHFGVTLEPDNPAQIAEYNFAIVIAFRAGVLDPLYRQLGMGKET